MDNEIKQHPCCCYCGKEMKKKGTIEHVVPLSSGGNNSDMNRRDCCYTCNQERGSMTIDEYAEFCRKKYFFTDPAFSGDIKYRNVLLMQKYVRKMGMLLYKDAYSLRTSS